MKSPDGLLRKPSNAASTVAGAKSHQFRVNVEAETTRAARALSEGLYGPPAVLFPVAQSLSIEAQRAARLEAELYVLRNSRSFRLTAPMRDLAHYVRTKPALHRVAKSAARVVRSLRNQFRSPNPPQSPT